MAENQAEAVKSQPEEGTPQTGKEGNIVDQGEDHASEEHDFVPEFQEVDQLDSRFAFIEEQFRKSFDERFSSGSQKTKKQFWEDETEMLRTSKIFREVSRVIGDEWRPIFTDLMAAFPAEITEEEKSKIEKQQPIIQSYKALTAWKEAMGPKYTVMHLVDVLRKHNMDDLADEVLNIVDNPDTEKNEKAKGDDKTKSSKPIQRKKSDVSAKAKPGILDNRCLLLLAKKVGEDWEPLGKALGIPEEELVDIREGEDAKTYQGAFKVLWAWRQTQPAVETEESRNILKAALEKVGKLGLLEELEAK